MRHRATRRPSASQAAAYNHEDVVAIVTELVANPDLRLLKLADSLSLVREEMSDQQVRDFIGATLLADDELGPVAERVAAHARGIATAPTRDVRVRRRGALLERLVCELVAARPGVTAFNERDIELTHNPRSRLQWTNPKEVVAESEYFEVYECKSDGLPDIGDIDELSDVATTALAEQANPRPTIVTLGTDVSLKSLARAWRLTETIYGVTANKILSLASSAPSHPIQP